MTCNTIVLSIIVKNITAYLEIDADRTAIMPSSGYIIEKAVEKISETSSPDFFKCLFLTEETNNGKIMVGRRNICI